METKSSELDGRLILSCGGNPAIARAAAAAAAARSGTYIRFNTNVSNLCLIDPRQCERVRA